MLILFVISSDVAVVATLLAVTARVTLHALLYLAMSLIAVALVFYALGAPFVAALEVIVYAGAIVVLFIFAVMLLSPSEIESGVGGARRVREWLVPVILALVLLAEAVYVVSGVAGQAGTRTVPSREVGVALFGPYALGIELASMLLLVALIGVGHIAGHWRQDVADEAAAAATHIALRPPQADAAAEAPLGSPGHASTVGSGGGVPSRPDVAREEGSL
jgi:NADH-quinone oxidoreductase subunit J